MWGGGVALRAWGCVRVSTRARVSAGAAAGTPLYVWATAGVRALPEAQQRTLMRTVQQTARTALPPLAPLHTRPSVFRPFSALRCAEAVEGCFGPGRRAAARALTAPLPPVIPLSPPSVRQLKSRTRFRLADPDGQVRVISGEEEGVFGWLVG